MSPVVAAVAPFAHVAGGAAAVAVVNRGTAPLRHARELRESRSRILERVA